MRTGCSMLGVLEPELDFEDQDAAIERMLAAFPGIICYWHHFSQNGKRIDTDSGAESIAEHFLTLLHQKAPPLDHIKVMHASLILYAEHEFNASTFAARVAASTLTDIYSAVTGAIGTLRGPLHGGANEAAMAMIETFTDPDDAEQQLLAMLARKDKIMGFGHAVYRTSDPRNAIIKKWAKKLADADGDSRLYDIAERCETVMWREKELFPNADFFHAPAYHSLGIPRPCSRRFSSWRAPPAGPRISRSSARITASSDPVPTTSGRNCAISCRWKNAEIRLSRQENYRHECQCRHQRTP